MSPRGIFHYLLIPVIATMFVAIASTAAADSIQLSVSGYGYLGGNADGLSVSSGKTFSMYSAAPDGPSMLVTGIVGQSMDLTIYPFAYSGAGFTEVKIGNTFTDILNGGLIISSTFTVPASALFEGSFTAPINVTGDLTAYTDLTYGTGILTQGPLLGSLIFGGSGTGTFYFQPMSDTSFLITEEDTSFSATGTLNTTVHVTPEPGSLLLFGTGLAGLGLAIKDRRRSFIWPKFRNCAQNQRV